MGNILDKVLAVYYLGQLLSVFYISENINNTPALTMNQIYLGIFLTWIWPISVPSHFIYTRLICS